MQAEMEAISFLFRKKLETLLVYAIAMRFHDQAEQALTSISLSNKILLLSSNAAFLNFPQYKLVIFAATSYSVYIWLDVTGK